MVTFAQTRTCKFFGHTNFHQDNELDKFYTEQTGKLNTNTLQKPCRT